MNEIPLPLVAPPADPLSAANATADCAAWAFRRLMLFAVPLPMTLVFGVGIALFLGQPLGEAARVALYTCIGGLIGLLLANRVFARRYGREFAASSLRWQPLKVSLSDSGVTSEARQVLWSSISGTMRRKNSTLLHLLAVDALLIPDRDLPSGLSADDLAKRITEWRAA